MEGSGKIEEKTVERVQGYMFVLAVANELWEVVCVCT